METGGGGLPQAAFGAACTLIRRFFFAFILKLDHAINKGKKRVVPPEPDIEPRFERRPPLPHQNAAGAHCLPGKALHPKTFANAVTPIGRATLAFFVCHAIAPSAAHRKCRASLARGEPLF